MGKALYIQSVEEAVSLAGGREPLAALLGVSTAEIERWSAGSAIPETAVFLRLIDILLDRPLAGPEPVKQLAPAP